MLGNLFVCATVLIGLVNSGNIPDYIHICKRSDPRVAKCIRESVELLRPKLREGIPELGVPGLEPLNIKEVAIFRGNTNNFKAYLRNIQVHGASNFQITKLKLDIDKTIFRVGIKIPALRLDGDYEIDARILVVPIKGNGKFTANVTQCEGQGVLRAEIINHPDKREIRFNSFDFAIRIGDYNIHLDNLFNGDPVLSQAANDVLHQSKPEFIEAALPFIQRKVAEILLDIANQITKNVDYDEIFPEK